MIRPLAPLAASLTFAVACTSSIPESRTDTPDGSSAPAGTNQANACVAQSDISDIEVLDNYHVVLTSGGNQHSYLAKIAGGCFNFEDQSGFIPFDGDGNGQICGTGQDLITYRRLRTVQKCRIVSLEELSESRRRELGIGPSPSKPKKGETSTGEDGDAA